MSWTKLSDDFADDCWSLSDEAFRLHVEGLCWSNRKLLDLVLDDDDVRRFAKHPEAVQELLDVGWWSYQDGQYVIRHHGAYQRPREMVLKLQEVASKNGKKGGRPPRERAPKNPAANPAANPRDNPQGQARTGQGSTKEPTTESAWAGIDIAVPGRPLCKVCSEPMVVVEVGQQSHATCDLLAVS